MKSKVKNTVLVIISAIVGILAMHSVFSAVALADEVAIDQNVYLENLINQARKNPLTMAALIGKDPEQVIKDFPDKALILSHGLPQVVHNDKLQASAIRHSLDMLENQYFAYQSLDGSRPIDRMQAEGYRVSFSGEKLGMIGFYNFIGPEEAVWALFKKMFAEELDPARKESWVILNPAMSEIGVSVSKGTFSISDQSFNAYFGVCDFGSSRTDVYAAERFLMQSINKARETPSFALETAGIGLAEAVASIGKENAWKLIIGLPPLAWNSDLHDIARAWQVDDAAATGVKDGVEFYTVSQTEFPGDVDYPVVDATEIRLSFYKENPDLTPVQIAALFFEELVKLEFGNSFGSISGIYSESFSEIGTSIEYAPVNGKTGYIWTAIVELAQPVASRKFIIGGMEFAFSKEQETPSQFLKKKIGKQIVLSEFTEMDEEADKAAASPLSVAYSGPLGGYQVEFDSTTSYNNIQVRAETGDVIYETVFSSSHDRNLINNICILDDDAGI